MAVTFTKLSASPYSLKYLIDAPGGGGALIRSAADVLADCAAGPLKSFLSAIDSGTGGAGGIADWNALEQGPFISVLNTPSGGSPIDTAAFVSGPNGFLAIGAAEQSVVEIRYWHSSMR